MTAIARMEIATISRVPEINAGKLCSPVRNFIKYLLEILRLIGIVIFVMEIKTISDLEMAVSYGKYTQLGMYPKYFITNDGGVLSFESVINNIEIVKGAINDDSRDGWRVCACDVNWESLLYCDHSGKQIESAYDPIDGE